MSDNYVANSLLVREIVMEGTNGTMLTVKKECDRLNRLQSISSTASGSMAPTLPLGAAYTYNSAGQRVQATFPDSLGQETSGKRYWQGGTLVAGQQFEYGFDDIGNRKTTGGRVSSRSEYTVNRLEQCTQRTNAPVAEITCGELGNTDP